MTALRLWLRVGSARWMLLAGTAAGVFALASRDGWYWDHASAATWAVTATVLIGPVLAGLVAHDTWRAASPAMDVVQRQSLRGGASALVPAAANFVAGAVALGLTILAAHVVALLFGADGSADPLAYARGVLALAASAGLGLLVGRLAPGFLTGPLAASLGYLVPIALRAAGASEVMVVRGVRRPAVFLDVTTEAAASQMLAAVGLVSLGVLLVALMVPRPVVRHAVVAGCGVLLLGGLLWSVRVGDAMEAREVGAARCTDGAVAVCGPPEAGKVVAVVASNLSEAARDLGDHGLSVQGATLELVAGDTRPSQGRGILQLPGELGRDGLSTEEVVGNLVTPVDCDLLRADVVPESLMRSASALGSWMLDRLQTDEPGTSAEAAAAQSVFDAMMGCEVPPAFEYVPLEMRDPRGR